MKRQLLPILAMIPTIIVAAEPAMWRREDKTDAFRGTHYAQFVLEGHFLSPPRRSSLPPRLVVQCLPGEHRSGRSVRMGKYVSSYLIVGPVMDGHLSGLAVQYRLDDGKIQTENWGVSTDFSSAFFNEIVLNTLVYGHFMPHKENTSPPVKKVVIATDEFTGGEVVMQFDMPAPDEMADACGLIVHKR